MSQQENKGRPLLTLTTDFGTADGSVGAIKGRVLSMAPQADICDISHDIAPQGITEGAWCLRKAVPNFPQGTVHLAVIDPGVGSARAGLIVKTERFLLVGPDNGVLSLAAQDDGIREIYAIGEAPPERERSSSFDGLTFFAPTAARLLTGAGPEELGEKAEGMEMLALPSPRRVNGGLAGEILFFDHFGNAITNITPAHLEGSAAGKVELPSGEIRPVSAHYEELQEQPDRTGAIWNSDGHLELALYSGSLREKMNLKQGSKVKLLIE